MIKQGAQLRKVWAQKVHVLQKLFFISKDLQLTPWITVNRAVPCTLETSGINGSLPLKKKRKEKARSSTDRSSEKSRNTNTLFQFRKITITSEDYKIYLYIPKNYNQQGWSPHLKKKIITISRAVLHIDQRPVKAKPQERERKGERERERERERRGEKEKEGEGERENGG